MQIWPRGADARDFQLGEAASAYAVTNAASANTASRRLGLSDATRVALAPTLRAARASGRRVVVVAGPVAAAEWARLLEGAEIEVLRGAIRTAALLSAARPEASPGGRVPLDRSAPALLLIDGVSSLAGWAFLERAEARLVRLMDTVASTAGLRAELLVRDPTLAARAATVPEGTDPPLDRLRARAGIAAPPITERRGAQWGWRVLALAALCVAVAPLVAGVFVGPQESTALVLGGAETRVPGALWLDSWIAGALARGDLSALVKTDEIWWPFGVDLAATFGNLAPAVLAAPLVYLFGYPGFWNVFIALALVVNGAAAASLARAAGAHRVAALLAGISFAVAPPLLIAAEEGRQAQLLAFVLPLALRAGLHALDGHRPRDFVRAAALTVGAGYVWWWYGGLAFAVLLVGWLDRLVRDPAARPLLWANIRRASYLVVPLVLAAVPLVVAVHGGQVSTVEAGISVLDSGGDPGADARILEIAGGSLTPEQLVFGGGPLPASGVQSALVGLALLALIVLPLGRRPGWLVLAGGFGVLALGPWITVGDTAYEAPWDLLYRWAPFFSRSGVPVWMLVPAALCLGVWLALALTELSPRADRGVPAYARVGIVGLGLALALALPGAADRLPLARFSFDPPAWWSLMGEEGAVIVIPFVGDDMPLAYQPLHGHPLALGPSPGTVIESEGPVKRALDVSPLLRFLSKPSEPPFDRRALDDLWDAGLRWIVIDQPRMRGLLEAGAMGLRWAELGEQVENIFGPARVATFDVRIYAVRDVRDAVSLDDGAQ